MAGWHGLELGLAIGEILQVERNPAKLLSLLSSKRSTPTSRDPLPTDPVALGLCLAEDPLGVLVRGDLDGEMLDQCMALWSRNQGTGDAWKGALFRHVAQGFAGETGGCRARRLLILFNVCLNDMSPELCLDISYALLTLIEANDRLLAHGYAQVSDGVTPAMPSASKVTGLLDRFLQSQGFDTSRKDRPFGAPSDELAPLLRRDDKQSGLAMEVWKRTALRDTNKIGSPIAAMSKDQRLAMTARKVTSLWTSLQAQLARLLSELRPRRNDLRISMIMQCEMLAHALSREFPSLRATSS